MSSDLTLVLKLLAQAEGAIRGVQAVGTEVRKVGVEAEHMGQRARASSQNIGMMAAQWNDIVMMTLAGQNPMQMAIQQGTQMTQAYGSGGAAGAVKLLGAGLMQMVNPLNLVTIAGIAAGSALVQWIMDTKKEVPSAADAIKALAQETDAYAKAAKAATAADADLWTNYGAGASAARDILRELADMQQRAAVTKAQSSASAIRQELGVYSEGGSLRDIGNYGALGDMFDLSIFGKGRQQRQQMIGEVIGAFEQIDQAATLPNAKDRLDAMLAGTQQLAQSFEAAARSSGSISDAEQAQLDLINQQLEGLLRLKAQTEALDAAEEKRTRRLAVEAKRSNERMGGPSRGDLFPAEDGAKAKELLATLQQQAKVQDTIREYGAQSAQAAAAKLDVERQAFSEMVDTLRVSADTRDRLREAWDAANGVARANMAAAIEAAIGPASRLAGLLSAAGSWLAQMSARAGANAWVASNQPGGAGYLANQYAAYGMGHDAMVDAQRLEDPLFKTLKIPAGSTGGGGGGGTDPLIDLKARAARAMADLDTALAAVQLKVSAGILSSAEGDSAALGARQSAADTLAELIPQLDKLGPAGQVAAETWRDAFTNLAKTLGDVSTQTSELAKTMTDGFKAPFADFLSGTKSASAAWGDFVSFVDRSIAEKLANKFSDQMLGPVLDGLFAGLGGIFKFAKGGVPGLSELSGQVLDGPTLFAMPGGGMGEAGEAGKEAVMPTLPGPRGLSVAGLVGGKSVPLALARGADGRLAVEVPWVSSALAAPRRFAMGGVPGLTEPMSTAQGGSAAAGGRVSVIVHNNAPGVQPTVRESNRGNERVLEIMIDAVRDALADDIGSGRGPLPAAMSATFGLSRQGR